MLKTLNDEGSDIKERELLHVSEKIKTAAGFGRTCHIVVSRMPWVCAPLMNIRPNLVLGGFQIISTYWHVQTIRLFSAGRVNGNVLV
jgi:hypothetical protein